MTDTRSLRDRLGETLRAALHAPGPRIVPWDAKRPDGDETRENWRREADRILEEAPARSLKITVEDNG